MSAVENNTFWKRKSDGVVVIVRNVFDPRWEDRPEAVFVEWEIPVTPGSGLRTRKGNPQLSYFLKHYEPTENPFLNEFQRNHQRTMTAIRESQAKDRAEAEEAAAKLVEFLRDGLGATATITNIDDGDVIIVTSDEQFMIHVRYL